MKFYKWIKPEGHQGLVYQEGLNTDIIPFNPNGDCKPGGIYFSRGAILAFIHYGEDLYEVEPVGEVYENPNNPKKWKAHTVNLKYIGKASDIKVIKLLVDEGADIHIKHERLLRWATLHGHTEIVAFALDHNPDIHACNDYPLLGALIGGHKKIAQMLLDKGADIHACETDVLRYAIEDDDVDMIKFMLNAGAVPNHCLLERARYSKTEIKELIRNALEKNSGSSNSTSE